MKRIVAALVVGVMLAACTNKSLSDSSAESVPKCRFHGALNDVGCLYGAAELAGLTRRNHYPVWVYHGIPQKHGDAYLLRVSNAPDAPFIVLDWTAVPATELQYGLNPLLGWKTRVVGRYTSSDVTDPGVPGASGTLVAVDIGWLYDPDRPEGPYAKLRVDTAQVPEKATADR